MGRGKNFIPDDVKKKEKERWSVQEWKLADLFSEGSLGTAYIIPFGTYIKRQSYELVLIFNLT